MRPLLIVVLCLGALFASTFFLANVLGILTAEQIEQWFERLATLSPWTLGALVVALLFADLFIAVPTMTICLLAGYFLGFPTGSMAAGTGMMLAGIGGHLLCRQYGDRILRLILRDEQQRQEAAKAFARHGIVMILLSRASPILPEVTACLSGINNMPFRRFTLVWTVSSLPNAMITTYAGSISTVSNPVPAIVTAIALSVTFWLAWFAFHRHHRKMAQEKG